MKTDSYVKGLLLLMTAFLGIMACRTDFQSETTSAQTGGKLNIQVLCSSCSIPQASQTAHLIILDQTTGKVWAYKELNQPAVYMGMINEIGAPLQIQK